MEFKFKSGSVRFAEKRGRNEEFGFNFDEFDFVDELPFAGVIFDGHPNPF